MSRGSEREPACTEPLRDDEVRREWFEHPWPDITSNAPVLASWRVLGQTQGTGSSASRTLLHDHKSQEFPFDDSNSCNTFLP